MSPVLSSKYRREVKELPVTEEATKKESIKEPAISQKKHKQQPKVKYNANKDLQIESVPPEKQKQQAKVKAAPKDNVK